MSMDPISSSAGSLVSFSAGLGTQFGVKTKWLVNTYLCSAFYKKPKKPTIVGNMVETSAGFLVFPDMITDSNKPVNKTSSINGILDLENMKNTVVEETSYADSNVLEIDDTIDDTTPRKICTRTYVLNSQPKILFFDNLSDDNDNVLILLVSKFSGVEYLPNDESHVLNRCNFEPLKSFVLDIKLSVVPGKTNSDKLFAIKKIFYRVDGFGEASTPSKFSRIIESSFTSEFSLNKAKELAICKKILVNNNLRKVNIHSDREIIVKKIPVDFPKSAVESVFSKFGKIVSIKIQLIGLWQKALVEFELSEVASSVAFMCSVLMGKDSMQVALAIEDKQSWVFRDQHRTLLYTLPVGITVHDLSGLLDSYGRKTCFIGRNPNSYVHNKCAVVCFADEASKLAAIDSVPFGHVSDVCSIGENSGVCGKRMVSDQDRVCLAGIYKKKQAPIARPVFFGGKTWVQIAGGSLSRMVSLVFSSANMSSGGKLLLLVSSSSDVFGLNDCLAVLECFLELLADQISDILKKLNGVDLVPLVPLFCGSPLAVSVPEVLVSNLDMLVDHVLASSDLLPSNVNVLDASFGSSISKILTIKIDGLESKLLVLEAFIVWKFATCNVHDLTSSNMVSFVTETKLHSSIKPWIANRFDGVCVFMSGLDKGFFGAEMAIIMDSSLTCHVSRVKEISGWVISIRLLFKGKLSVTFLGLYTGVSSRVRFGQASVVNSLIVKTVNSSTFVVLGGNFNENGSGKSTSFKFCLDLGLVNSFADNSLVKAPTWGNSRGVEKTIDYIFINTSLSSAVAGHGVNSVSDFFDTDHKAVVVSIGLGRLLDVCLNNLCKQANRDHWKFRIKNADCAKWSRFRNCSSTELLGIREKFLNAGILLNLDLMWSLLEKIMVVSADKVFSWHWFSKFQCFRNKQFSKFFGLEMLVAKISVLDADEASVVLALIRNGKKTSIIFKHLFLLGEKASIKKAIARCMDKFCSDKDGMIRSVLDCPFHKVVLDHLVVDDGLVLEPKEVKVSINSIMENWMRKQVVPVVMPALWTCQYAPLDYVQNNTFSGVIHEIGLNELLLVVKNLPKGKAAGLSGIPNELCWWGAYFVKKGMILTNTWPIALIKTARKILSKILSNHISLAYSKFGVLHGNNFLSLMFAVGLVIEDTIEKNREIWLVLQDMRKAYDSVGWYHLRTSLQ
ncbi:hypothetical protein G9A89_017576 [Geosiphon pyriformis]|nr:hypothetical protein G9A89_017576 [Geosiphon pyriformis]